MRKIWFILASMSAVACFSLTTWRQPLVAAENLPPCVAVSTNEHCNSPGGPGSASITHVGVWSPVCLGEMAYAWADITNVAARVVTVVNYTPAGTNCPPDVDVRPEDVPYTVTWTVNGPGDFFAQGEGEDAQFTPTTNGTGTIRFSLTYSNPPPCTGTDSNSKSAQFVVKKTTEKKRGELSFRDPQIASGQPIRVLARLIAEVTFNCCNTNEPVELRIWSDEDSQYPCGTWLGDILEALDGTREYSRTVDLTGSLELSFPGVPPDPAPPYPGNLPAEGYTGWSRRPVVQWSVNYTNCDAQITFTQPQLW